eukprot:1144345-Pelagomonas_calceolata.AAC.5
MRGEARSCMGAMRLPSEPCKVAGSAHGKPSSKHARGSALLHGRDEDAIQTCTEAGKVSNPSDALLHWRDEATVHACTALQAQCPLSRMLLKSVGDMWGAQPNPIPNKEAIPTPEDWFLCTARRPQLSCLLSQHKQHTLGSCSSNKALVVYEQHSTRKAGAASLSCFRAAFHAPSCQGLPWLCVSCPWLYVRPMP